MSRGSLSKDIESQSQSTVKEYLDGFADVSAYIGSDCELALFRRFDVLGARNLLYLQARLCLLEAKLEKYDEEDIKIIKENSEVDGEKGMKPSGPESLAWDILLAAKDWGVFESRARKEAPNAENSSKNGDGDGRHSKRMDTVIEIQEALKQYQEALILHTQVLQLESPGSRALEVFKKWFTRKQPFANRGNELLKKNDIAALRPSRAQDRLSKILQKRAGWIFQEKRDVPPSWGEMVYFSEKHLTRAVQFLSVIFSALALTGAIISLHYIKHTEWRFGALGGFLLMFTLIVGTLTNAKTSEMFGATAAFAAVLVVFIATGLPA
ncbi:hypothetical protein G7Y89_g7374 [Cudoniella acicularis]|uniref:DUF6594 domain-containing protein n=1 Tax=Cudoniella acicularis TaxID=354080 RepID=A0A8H4W1L5_9HELO|nr:hypothetical protein G7Y89_g7374 [Cudoniella acicularis]